MIEVFARRANREVAAALVARLEAEGRPARANNSAWFDASQIDANVQMVYHDGEDRRVPETYEELGIPCELIPGHEPEGDVPVPVVKERPPEADGCAEPVQVVQSGRWYTAYRGGEKVGKSQRTEEAAWALLREPESAG